MLYKEYGKTGKKISVISAGGMRHRDPADLGYCADMLLQAYEGGVNYFDTAPMYSDDKSEEIVGKAVAQMQPGTFYVATKSMKETGAELREELERSLERIGTGKIDFFHIWCILSKEAWEKRKKGGVLDAVMKAKEEGLIGHLVFSTHMVHNQAEEVIAEGIFEGMTVGYNALNFPLRQKVVDTAHAAGLGVATMNPLHGGLIPQLAEDFAFIRDEDTDDTVSAALRFNISQPGITTALVGFSCKEEVDAALKAVENFTPYPEIKMQTLKKQIRNHFDGLCTGCCYCLPCPQEINIPVFMDVWNVAHLKKNKNFLRTRLKNHFRMTPSDAAKCVECGLCETRCTQHLPIMKRLREITEYGDGDR